MVFEWTKIKNQPLIFQIQLIDYICKKIYLLNVLNVKKAETHLIMKQIKRIKIHHFGPLLDADINLKRINLIIGLQSSGKSCAMMIACFCSWVEKRIILRQSAKEFENDSYFIDSLISYYNVKEYLHNDTCIEYHSDYMTFQYSHETRQLTHHWEKKRWSYERPKISYIPAERGIVSLISNWNKL